MTRHRSHSAAFKQQVAEEFIAGETLHALSQRHDISRQLIRIWVGKFEAGALDDDVQAADLLQEYEAKIAALERMVGRQALEIELLKGTLELRPGIPRLADNCFHSASIWHQYLPWKQKRPLRAALNSLAFPGKIGAGEGIRTLDPNLGKVVLYP